MSTPICCKNVFEQCKTMVQFTLWFDACWNCKSCLPHISTIIHCSATGLFVTRCFKQHSFLVQCPSRMKADGLWGTDCCLICLQSWSIARAGEVGLLDLDIYGPSLPELVRLVGNGTWNVATDSWCSPLDTLSCLSDIASALSSSCTVTPHQLLVMFQFLQNQFHLRLPPNCATQNEAGRIIPIDYGTLACESLVFGNVEDLSVVVTRSFGPWPFFLHA